MKNTHLYHYFLDEAGDTTFYGKGKVPIMGKEGVSQTFMLCMVSFKTPLAELKESILLLAKKISESSYYKDVPSVVKRLEKGNFYFHAKDDLPEIRKEFFDLIKNMDCRAKIIVGRKKTEFFERKHEGKEANFYADLLSHLLKDKLHKYPKIALNIAERANSTAINNLENGLKIAQQRSDKKFLEKEKATKVSFTVHKFQDDPLLSVADYLCWAVQRVFERGEMRFYDFMQDKFSLIVDLYDRENYEKGKNYYNARNPLTQKNKVSPHTP